MKFELRHAKSHCCLWNVIEIYYLSKAIIRPFHSPSKQYSPNTVQSPWPQNISSKPYRSTLVCNLKEATFGTNWRSYQHKKNKINRAGNSDDWRTQNCPPQNCPPKGISRAGNSDIHQSFPHLKLKLYLWFWPLTNFAVVKMWNCDDGP